ncbi:MAG: TPM domain-containing protein [Chlamydiia bacterium]
MRRLGGCLVGAALCSGVLFGELAIPPSPKQWLTDTARVLSPEERAEINHELQTMQTETGHQVVVWIGDSLEGSSLEEWSVKTFEAWGIGKAKADDGVAWFLFMGDRRMRIEVGYGLEPLLTDAKSSQVIQAITPMMRQGEVAQAIRTGVRMIASTIAPEHVSTLPEDEAPPSPALGVLLGLLMLGGLFAAFVFLGGLYSWLRGKSSHDDWRGPPGGMGGGGFGGFGGMGGFGGGGRSGGGGASGGW